MRKFLIVTAKEFPAGWVRFTTFVPSISKLHDNAKRALSQWRNALVEMQNGKCFYDETHEMSSPEVDHVFAMVICSGGQDLEYLSSHAESATTLNVID